MFPQAHIRPLPLLVLILPLSAQAQSPSYPVTGTTSLIPWSELRDSPTVSFNFDDTPHARIQFSYSDPAIPGSPWTQSSPNWYSFSVDTGTCGIVAHKKKVNLQESEKHDPDPADPTTLTNQGQQYLSSSKILYAGYWVPRQVAFVHSTPMIRTFQPVLAVTRKFTNCVHWEESMGNGCPGATEITPDTVFENVSILGTGYGRTHDGQPQGTPDKNPLLNIVSIGGTAIGSLATFHPGWRIDANGVQVGLTQDIWNPPGRSWSTINLWLGTPSGITRPSPPESASRNPHTPWSELRGGVTFPGALPGWGEVPVSLLLDTGIDWSSIRVEKDLAEAARNNGVEQLLKVDQIAEVGNGTIFQRYKYTNTGPVPPACYWTPEYTKVTYDNIYYRPNFVNTGRRAFKVWGFAFDPWNGRVGFQRRDDTCAATIP